MSDCPAVLFLGHRRPKLAREVFARIREAGPARLYLAVDGPKSREEEADCAEMRSLASEVDWKCDVQTLFQERNLGCRKAVSTAITWFFESEAEGIILEEDCVPEPTFFSYCGEALDRYRGNPEAGWISGYRPAVSEGVCAFQTWSGSPWGWATWRDVWKGHDPHLSNQINDWEDIGLRKWLNGGAAVRLWEQRQRASVDGYVNSWFFPWQLHLIRVRKMVLMPAVNLVSNKGFGAGATHTISPITPASTRPHPLPIRFPGRTAPDRNAERLALLGSLSEMTSPARSVQEAVQEVLGSFNENGALFQISRMLMQGNPPDNPETMPARIRMALVGLLPLTIRRGLLAPRAAEKMRRIGSRLEKTVEPLAMQCEYETGGRFVHGRLTYGQEGEDLILEKLFEGQETGFFVDVGAHHPFRFSNTQLLYERGWRGINIEPTPGLIQKFELWRPEDINLAVAAGSESGAVAFHVFDEGGYNTLSAEIAGSRISSGKGAGHRVVEVPVRTLGEILAQHVPEGKAVDLMTIDTEGHDLEVLRGMDWGRWKPRVILCEYLGTNNLSAPGGIPAVEFLQPLGYRFFAATFNTLFFELDHPPSECQK